MCPDTSTKLAKKYIFKQEKKILTHFNLALKFFSLCDSVLNVNFSQIQKVFKMRISKKSSE